MRRRLLPFLSAALSSLLVVGLGAELGFRRSPPKILVLRTPESAVAQEKKAEKRAAAKTASGTVKSVSADGLVVAGKVKGKGEELTFAIDSKTSIKKGGKSITAADIKTGDIVLVMYTEDGARSMAQSITVSGDAAAKKTDATREMEKIFHPAPRYSEPGRPAGAPGFMPSEKETQSGPPKEPQPGPTAGLPGVKP